MDIHVFKRWYSVKKNIFDGRIWLIKVILHVLIQVWMGITSIRIGENIEYMI